MNHISALFTRLGIRKSGKLFVIAVCITIGSIYFVSGNVIFSSSTRVIYSLDKRENDREIVSLIDEARKYVYFAVYYFTDQDIVDAVIRAKKRGLEVRGIVDRDGTKLAANKRVFEKLKQAGVEVQTQKHLDGLMHLKVLVTDKAFATGSYNWTQAATTANDEVLEIGYDSSIKKQYYDIVTKVLKSNTALVGDNKPILITYDEAPKYVGQTATVSGEVKKVSKNKSGTVLLKYCETAKCPFTVVIFASDSDKFKDIEKLKGKITVKGVIRAYRGSAEMVVSDPTQLQYSTGQQNDRIAI